MKRGFVAYLKSKFVGDIPLHPVDQKIAKQWIKRRLVIVFPELKNDPVALERAYQQLDLVARPGTRQGESAYEVILP